MVQPTDKNYLNGMWGKLACEILTQNWEAALDELKRLQMFIDESTFGSSLQSLQQKTWLIHWSLFVFFNHPKVGRNLRGRSKKSGPGVESSNLSANIGPTETYYIPNEWKLNKVFYELCRFEIAALIE